MDATEVVHRFIAAINAGDVAGLAHLMSADHTLQVFDEPALVGREANVDGWQGYCSAFPRYRIHVHDTAERAGAVAVRGHTTGSHLALPDTEEERLTLIWLAEVGAGKLRTWQLIDDSVGNRERVGLASTP
ncbi:MAG: hypothetical protein QOG87_181 [Actinomycetota bacterium]